MAGFENTRRYQSRQQQISVQRMREDTARQAQEAQQAEQQRLLEERQRQAQQLNWFQRALEVPALPGAIVQTALGIRSNEGVTPLAASLARLGGRNVQRPNVETFLQQRGMGEGPAIQTPLGHLTGRGILGFAGDIATDPITWLFPGSQVNKAAQAVEKVKLASSLAGDVLPRMLTIQDALQASQPTSTVEKLGARLGQVKQPQAERALSTLNLISPGILQKSPIAQVVGRAYESVLDARQSFKIPRLARFQQLLPENVIQGVAPNQPNVLTTGGRLPGQATTGGLTAIPFGTVAESRFPERLAGTEIRPALDYANRVLDDEMGRYQPLLRSLPKLVQKQFELAGGPLERYFPRVARHIATGDIIAMNQFGKPVGGQRAFQKLRQFDTIEQGIASGEWEYITDPVKALGAHIDDVEEKIAQMQLIKELLPLAKVFDPVRQLALRGQRIETRAGLKSLSQAMRDIRAGTATADTAQFLEQNYPDIYQELVNRGGVTKIPGQAAIPTQAAIPATTLAFTTQRLTRQQAIDLIGEITRAPPAGLSSPFGSAGSRFPNMLHRNPDGSYVVRVRDYVKNTSEQVTSLDEWKARFGDQFGLTPSPTVPTVPVSPPVAPVVGASYAFAPLNRQGRQAVGKLQVSARTAGRANIARLGGEISAGTEQAIRAGRVELSKAGHQGVSFLKDLWFTPTEGKEIADILTAQAPAALTALRTPTAALRTIMTVVDFSGAMIQGLPGLMRDPRAFLTALGKSFEAWANPESFSKYAAEQVNQYTWSKIPVTLVTGGESEFGLIQRSLFDQPGPIAQKVEPQLSRFQRSFTVFGDILRTEWAKGLLPTVEKSGDTALREAANFIDHATGVISSRGMGIRPTQRAWEGTVFFFAPRYLRSSLAVVGDMLSGGVQRDEALKTLGSMLFVGTAWYNALSRATGQEPINDPSDSRFMTLQVGDQRIGIGSTWVSLARLAARIAIDPKTGQYDPGRILDLDADNPIFEFWRGRLPPATSAVWDVIQGESFSGYPVTDSVWDALKYAGTKFLPFSVQGIIETGLQGAPVAAGQLGTEFGAGFVGLRSFPARYEEQLDRTATQQFGAPFDQLPPAQKAALLNQPQFAERQPSPGQRGERARDLRDIFGTREQEITRYAQLVESGALTKENFRERVSEIDADLGAQLERVEPKQPGRLAIPLEQSRQDYLAILHQKDEFGQTRFDEAEQFLETLPAEVRDYIDEQREMRNLQLPEPASSLMEELRQARIALRPYRDILDQVLKQRGLLDEYQAMSPAQRESFVNSRRFNRIQSDVTRRKELWRRRNPKGDQYLVDWYGLQPIRGRRR